VAGLESYAIVDTFGKLKELAAKGPVPLMRRFLVIRELNAQEGRKIVHQPTYLCKPAIDVEPRGCPGDR
jgi:hypothetical protein